MYDFLEYSNSVTKRVKGLTIKDPKNPDTFISGNKTQFKHSALFSILKYLSKEKYVSNKSILNFSLNH